MFELLEARGFEVKLVDARHVKNVSGRKSDVLDCQWLQQLHTYGLLAGAFRPPDEVCVLRSYLRQREMLRQAASQHIQHLQKALQQMNLLLHNVVSDITGVTGMKIIKAILAGERDPRRSQVTVTTVVNRAVPRLLNHWLATIARNICSPCARRLTSMRYIRPRLPTVMKRLSNSWKKPRTSLTTNRPPATDTFKLVTEFEVALMCASCYSRKVESICLLFPV